MASAFSAQVWCTHAHNLPPFSPPQFCLSSVSNTVYSRKRPRVHGTDVTHCGSGGGAALSNHVRPQRPQQAGLWVYPKAGIFIESVHRRDPKRGTPHRLHSNQHFLCFILDCVFSALARRDPCRDFGNRRGFLCSQGCRLRFSVRAGSAASRRFYSRTGRSRCAKRGRSRRDYAPRDRRVIERCPP